MYKYLPYGLLLYLLIASRQSVAGIQGIKRSQFLPPYNSEGKTNFKNTLKKSGAYLIKESGQVVYIGYSASNLYKTMYRHFQYWNDPTQYRATYSGKNGRYTIRVILCTPTQAQRLERYLVNKIKPRDNEQKLEMFANNPEDRNVYKKYKKAETLEPLPF